jgi:Na+-transporting NADH:ubiquinone oxidoreductase subunit F
MTACKIVVNSGKKIIDVEKGCKLIDALSGQGIYLPSACGSTGRCGLCKVNVKLGGGPFSASEMNHLTATQREAHVRLACQVEVSGDLEIELPPEFLMAQNYTSVVKKKRFLTKDIVELTLELVTPSSIHFHSGQYITLKMPAYEGKKAEMRPFSIASSNADQSFIQLNVRLNPQGTVTPWILNELQEGQEVGFSGPRGNFFIRNSMRPMIFVAGGSGMAPVRSILKTMQEHHSTRSVLFFFGALTQNDLFYIDEIEQLKKDLENFTFIPVLSNEPEGSDWKGERGLVTEAMDRMLTVQLKEYEAYLCGKPAMIEGCLPAFDKKEIDKERIFFDLFSSPKQAK